MPVKLAEARSCLAALADASPHKRSIDYEHLLLDLDAMHGGHGPATFPIAGSAPELHRRLEARLGYLAEIGADPLTIELTPRRLDEIHLRPSEGLRGEGSHRAATGSPPASPTRSHLPSQEVDSARRRSIRCLVGA